MTAHQLARLGARFTGAAMGVAAATPSLKYLDPGAPSFTLRPYLLALTIRIRMGTWSAGCVTDEGGGIGFAQGPSYLTLTPTNADHAGACEPALRTLTHSFSALSLLGAAAAVTAAVPPVSAGVVVAAAAAGHLTVVNYWSSELKSQRVTVRAEEWLRAVEKKREYV